MKIAYHVCIIFPIIWELMVIFNPNKIHTFCLNQYKTQNEVFDINDWTFAQQLYSFLWQAYMLWLVIGLMFSFQWPIFLLLLVIKWFNKELIQVRYADALISVVALTFIAYNLIIFQIDIWELIKPYLKNP